MPKKDKKKKGKKDDNTGVFCDLISQHMRMFAQCGESALPQVGSPDAEVGARACGQLGHAHLVAGSFQTALEYYEKQLTLAQETGSRRAEAAACENLGQLHARRGEFTEAVELMERFVTITKEEGDVAAEARACSRLGRVYALASQDPKAREYFDRSMSLAAKALDSSAERAASWQLGRARFFFYYLRACRQRTSRPGADRTAPEGASRRGFFFSS